MVAIGAGPGTGDGGFEVSGEAAFDDPTSEQQGKAGRSIEPLDDLQRLPSDLAQRAVEFPSGIGAVGGDMPQTGKRRADRSQERRSGAADAA